MSAPYQPHSATSRAAATKIAPHLNSIRYRVYCFIAANPGVTDDEICSHLGLNTNTARPRRIELERRELVRWNGMRVGHLGATALTWEIVPGKDYPERWTGVSDPAATETGEARIRRNLYRAFPVRNPAVDPLLECFIDDLIADVDPTSTITALQKVLTTKDLLRILQFVVV